MPRIGLKKPVDVSRYLANLIRKVENGKIEAQTAGRIGYLCNILLKSYETSDLEDRITYLEEKLTEVK